MAKHQIKCFFLTPIKKAQVSLRRYSSHKKDGTEKKCSANPGKYSYHDASVTVGVVDWDEECGLVSNDRDHSDPLWPKHCGCGYKFTEEDEWQHNRDVMLSRSDGGEDTTLRNAPVGAMWNAHWLPSKRTGPDGIALVVKTPGGDWQIDGPSWNKGKAGPGWTRTGQIPDVTARPSILMTKYHGWLTNGMLIEC